jgi:hypothetical protein
MTYEVSLPSGAKIARACRIPTPIQLLGSVDIGHRDDLDVGPYVDASELVSLLVVCTSVLLMVTS